jgi:hypothetical protein
VQIAAGFCLFHLAVCTLLTIAVTPWRESLSSWTWRLRGRLPWLKDLLVGERSENGAALAVFGICGLAGLLFALVPPGLGAPQSFQAALGTIAVIAAATFLLLVSVGSLYQWCVWIAGRSGGAGCLLMVATFVLVPHIGGHYFGHELLMSLSPSAHFAQWLAGESSLPLFPLLALYGLILVTTRVSLTRRLRAHQAAVDRKLADMRREAATVIA